jgi:hypothetical protein
VVNVVGIGIPGMFVTCKIAPHYQMSHPKLQKQTPTCAVCRAKLTKAAPMIPNLAMDNTVEKHIQALQLTGNKEWQPRGSKMKEWNARKE